MYGSTRPWDPKIFNFNLFTKKKFTRKKEILWKYIQTLTLNRSLKYTRLQIKCTGNIELQLAMKFPTHNTTILPHNI